ncbi:MAG: cobalamin-dependent protein [Phycisphaerae bacterium]|nr:cobalamin-dependent protein [Phycisphaerae bacterium]
MSKTYRILLIKPRQNIVPYAVEPPLGIMYLANYLRQQQPGIELRIIDMTPKNMSYARLTDQIRAFKPDMVGVTALTVESRGFHRTAAIAKRLGPDTVVVGGGPHPSAYPEKVMGDANFDYLIIGEGELAFDELVTAIRNGEPVQDIDRLVYRTNGRTQANPQTRFIEDLDAMPFPAWDLIPIRKYKNFVRMSNTGRGDFMALFTSRACPFKCIYCHGLFGKKFRKRSPENVLEEIRKLYDDYGIREFEIIDDIFNCDLERAKRICDLIIESGMKIRFTFPNGIRGDHMDEEFITKLRQAGCIFMAFAVETATPRLQKMLKKNVKLDKIKKNISLARKAGILCQGFFMLGFPTETREELQRTVDFAVDSDLHAAHLFVVNAYEGTALATLARNLGKRVHSDFEDTYMSHGFNNLTDLSDKELAAIRSRGIRRFWLKPSRIWAILRDYPDRDRFPVLLSILVKRLMQRG